MCVVCSMLDVTLCLVSSPESLHESLLYHTDTRLICCLCGHSAPMMDIRLLSELGFIVLSGFSLHYLTNRQVVFRFCPPAFALIWHCGSFSLKKKLEIRACGSLCAWFHMYVNVCMCTFPQVWFKDRRVCIILYISCIRMRLCAVWVRISEVWEIGVYAMKHWLECLSVFTEWVYVFM